MNQRTFCAADSIAPGCLQPYSTRRASYTTQPTRATHCKQLTRLTILLSDKSYNLPCTRGKSWRTLKHLAAAATLRATERQCNLPRQRFWPATLHDAMIKKR
ncbi:hypothetical protein, partial [Pseudomonas syringae]